VFLSINIYLDPYGMCPSVERQSDVCGPVLYVTCSRADETNIFVRKRSARSELHIVNTYIHVYM